eukprot:TRINITY_DN1661_c0_g1_i2.p1 TRINITY_DN1661_c0_g1~~TRINITY_DN1661_c0_g1_i2.p1  ORF type:complete len:176 (-),score=26.86 TRINITY_DN1661_c0_g1_i2:6-533(-)
MDMLDADAFITKLQEIVSSFISLTSTVEERIETMRELEDRQHDANMVTKNELVATGGDQINLNVGGVKFSTSKPTLTSVEGSYFHTMLSSDRWKPNDRGEYFIDRDPTHFPRILSYLRTGKLVFDGLDEDEAEMLNAELDYYRISLPIMPLDLFSKFSKNFWIGQFLSISNVFDQ